MKPRLNWHIFCRIIDNYGDAGVSFRLARQLANEYALCVTLWIDDLATLAKIQPQTDPLLDEQTIAQINVFRLATDVEPPAAWPDVIIDAFGGGLPPRWLDALARDFPPGNDIADEQKPRWLILEYLSAETFVDDMHGKPSPPPNIGIPRHFFFPGFSEKSGGLLREKDLIRKRDTFQKAPENRAAFFASLGVPPLTKNRLIVSLFCYDTPRLTGLLNIWNQSETPIALLAPKGVAENAIHEWREQNNENMLRIIPIPFLSQDDYDRLLWSCDLNFVRGEDSLVRAIWAGKPFIWQAYRQENNAHFSKLEAFLARYTDEMPELEKDVFVHFMQTWNGIGEFSSAGEWNNLLGHLPDFVRYAFYRSEKHSSTKSMAQKLLG